MKMKLHNDTFVMRAFQSRLGMNNRSGQFLLRLLLAFFGLFAGGAVHAQSTITWGTPTAITGDTDVATNGTLVYAYTESGQWAMVNGVSFASGVSGTALGSDVTMSGLVTGGGVDTGSYIGSNPVGLSSAYQTVVKGGAFNNGATATITLNNLTAGHQYLVQYWVCDYRAFGGNFNRSETLAAGNTSGALTYLQIVSGVNQGASSGTYVTGTFTASGTSQTITVTPNASAQMNAIQVRDLTPSPVQAQGIIYQDLFNDQQNINAGGPYTQTLAGSYPTARNSIAGGTNNATWTSAAETGGWGQRDYNNNGVATPTSSNYLPFTPEAGHLYLLTATIDATAWGNGEWFTIGFAQSPGNWGGTGNFFGDLSTNLVRGGQAKAISVMLDTRDPGWSNTQGLSYVGWVTDVAGQVNLNASRELTIDNFTLVILDPVTNTYNANGATSGTVPVDANNPYLKNTSVTVLGNTGSLAKTGFNFGGWNTAADGSGTTYSAGATFTIASNTVLYARWVSGFTVNYNGNGNTAGSVPVDANSYSSGATATVLGSNTLVKTGNSFVNWNKAPNGSGPSYNPGGSLTVNSNTTLYAQWSLNQYTATYLAGVGGTISGTATQTVSYGTSTTPVTAVPNAGYRFTGWSDAVATATRSDVNFTSNRTVTATFDNNLTWDNGAGTTNWNTTDANWTGSVWNNSVVDSASFNNVTNTVRITQAIAGGRLAANFGGAASGTHNFMLTGNTLSLTNIVVWGGYNPAAGGGGVNNISEANNQRLTISNSTVSVTGNVSVRRGSLMVQGNSVLNAAGLNTEGDNWAVFLMQDSASVTVTNGLDFSALACAAYLNGGTLTTPFVSVKDAAFNGTGGLFLDGGITLVPTGDTNDFIQVFNSGNNLSVHPATIGSGGLVINSAYAVTIANPLNGTGGLTKKGAGTLTLTAPYAGPTYGFVYPGNTYAGKTVVQGGVLSIGSIYALPGGAVSITNGAVMDLNYGGTIQVAGLTLNGVTQPNGTYGATGSGATYINDTYFTGTGVLNVYAVAGQTMTWTGATDNNWDEATANWTNGLGFNLWLNNSASPNSALFDATGLGQPNITVALASTLYASNLTFNAAGYDITNTLTLGNTPNFVANSDATISGLLNGSGGLTKTGNGTLTLTRYSELVATYSGATTVNAGTLALASGVAWILHGGSPVTVNAGATLQGNDSLANQLNGLTLNNGTVTATGSGNGDWGNFYLTGDVSASGTSTLNGDIALRAASVTFGVAGSSTLNVGGVLHNGYQFTGTILKSGAGTMVLSATNTYTGSTTVSNGTLMVNGSIASGATVNGGTLAGSGTIGGAVTVNSGGSIAAGAALNGIGMLTLNSNLTLNGNVLVNLNKSLAQSNSLFNVTGSLTNANGAATTLIVSNLGPALVAGDKFTVFNQPLSGGATVTLVPPAGVTLINDLAVDGSISVAPATAPTLNFVKSGNNLTFSWTGSGSLEWQTNSLSKGLSTNWVAYPNGTNGVQVPIDNTKGSVFFRVKQ